MEGESDDYCWGLELLEGLQELISIISFYMKRIVITIVPKEVGQLWDELLDDILNGITNPHIDIPSLPITDLIPHTYNPIYNVHQAKCYQQYTSNLCGYHATFNTLCFLNMIREGQTYYDILNGASFWDFKKRVEKFLTEIKVQEQLKDEWPWRMKDIIDGDFQRTYNKLCLERFADFEIFRKHDQFELYSFTWQFQFQNLIISEQKRKDLTKLINYFQNYNNEKPLIISFMLAITNHWMCMLAVKRGNSTQYWFFDSLQKDILDLSDEEIDVLVEEINEDRKKRKGEGYSDFFKKNIGVRMRDTQISLKLIIDCLEGKTTIDKYMYNQQFNIFCNKLELHWEQDHHELSKTIKDYWYNINSFFKFKPQYSLLNTKNMRRLQKLMSMRTTIRCLSEQGIKLHDLLQKYDRAIEA